MVRGDGGMDQGKQCQWTGLGVFEVELEGVSVRVFVGLKRRKETCVIQGLA